MMKEKIPMRRLICMLLLLMLPLLAVAEEPLTLLTADTVAEVNRFVILPEEEGLPSVQRGMVRFVSMNKADAAFRQEMWQNETYDLTQKGAYRADYRNMHTRAACSMALSYLGIDLTPAMMSELAGSRDVAAPFDAAIAKLPNVERVQPKAYVFDTMVENYLNDPSYSPVVCEVRKPSGDLHTVLIVGYIPQTGGFIICDPAAPKLDGETMHSYNMCWHVMRQVVLFSDFYDAFYASDVVALYQWKLTEN